MKKLFIGLTLLTSASSFAGTEVKLDKYLSLKSDSVESIGDSAKYSGISIIDSLNDKMWFLDNATNSPKAICKVFGHKKAIAFEVQDIRRSVAGSKVATCKLNYIDFDMFKTFEHGKFPITRENCKFDSGTNKTNFAYSSVTCI